MTLDKVECVRDIVDYLFTLRQIAYCGLEYARKKNHVHKARKLEEEIKWYDDFAGVVDRISLRVSRGEVKR